MNAVNVLLDMAYLVKNIEICNFDWWHSVNMDAQYWRTNELKVKYERLAKK